MNDKLIVLHEAIGPFKNKIAVREQNIIKLHEGLEYTTVVMDNGDNEQVIESISQILDQMENE